MLFDIYSEGLMWENVKIFFLPQNQNYGKKLSCVRFLVSEYFYKVSFYIFRAPPCVPSDIYAEALGLSTSFFMEYPYMYAGRVYQGSS